MTFSAMADETSDETNVNQLLNFTSHGYFHDIISFLQAIYQYESYRKAKGINLYNLILLKTDYVIHGFR